MAGEKKPERKIKIAFAEGFKEKFNVLAANRKPLKEKLRTFSEFKTTIPPRRLPGGFRDHELGDRLSGYRECHLADDVLLIYTLKNDELSLLNLCTHDEIKGGKEKSQAKTLKKKRKGAPSNLKIMLVISN